MLLLCPDWWTDTVFFPGKKAHFVSVSRFLMEKLFWTMRKWCLCRCVGTERRNKISKQTQLRVLSTNIGKNMKPELENGKIWQNSARSGKLLRRCKQWPFHFCCLCVRVFVCSEPYSPILMFYFIFDDFPEINGNCSTDKQSFHSYFKWVVGICFSLASRIFH